MLKLDIGCGGRGTMFEDFVGVDIWPTPISPRRPNAKYIQLNFVRDKLPWCNETVTEIVAFHIIEHLSPNEGEELLRRAYNLLKFNSKMYVSCPNLKLICQKYLEQDWNFYNKKYDNGKLIWKGKTLADRLNSAIHQEGHIWSYDFDSLKQKALDAGCKRVEELPIGHFWSRRPDHECGIIITKI